MLGLRYSLIGFSIGIKIADIVVLYVLELRNGRCLALLHWRLLDVKANCVKLVETAWTICSKKCSPKNLVFGNKVNGGNIDSGVTLTQLTI